MMLDDITQWWSVPGTDIRIKIVSEWKMLDYGSSIEKWIIPGEVTFVSEETGWCDMVKINPKDSPKQDCIGQIAG